MDMSLNPGASDAAGYQRGTPLWWVNYLNMRLLRRRNRYEKMQDYYRGEHILPEVDERTRDEFKEFQRKSRANYMKMVVDSVNERLEIVGFRTGAQGTDQTDEDAWAVWQANHLDADQTLAHLAALKYPDAYVLVGPPPTGIEQPDDGRVNEYPVITIEDPRQMIGEPDPIDRRRMRAAMKTWVDDIEMKKYAILYLPEAIYYFQSQYPTIIDTVNRDIGVALAPFAAPYGAWEEWKPAEANPIGVVPVVKIVAQPMEDGEGMGEFEDLIDVQDRINDTILNRMIVQKVQAYQQRWATGINTKDEEGNDTGLPFKPGVDMIWAVEDPDVKFGEFTAADIGPFLNSVRSDIQELVIRASLPPTYVMGDLVNVSADSVAAIEERLVAKCKSRARQLGEAWEQVMRLAFTYLGQPDRIGPDAEVQWADVRRTTPAAKASAAVQLLAAGVPQTKVWEFLGYTPTEIDRMQKDALQEQMRAALLAPPPASAPPGGRQAAQEPANGKSQGNAPADVNRGSSVS